mmetsp:Transcript_24714/g.40992  ORF Transcript_24714/g.40992 Transcript_24714/m.40992 type:complete len:213 (-) Transcript_24714:761-1399(-)
MYFMYTTSVTVLAQRECASSMLPTLLVRSILRFHSLLGSMRSLHITRHLTSLSSAAALAQHPRGTGCKHLRTKSGVVALLASATLHLGATVAPHKVHRAVAQSNDCDGRHARATRMMAALLQALRRMGWRSHRGNQWSSASCRRCRLQGFQLEESARARAAPCAPRTRAHSKPKRRGRARLRCRCQRPLAAAQEAAAGPHAGPARQAVPCDP